MELKQPEESAKRRAAPEDAAGRKLGVSAELARALRDLRDNRLTGIGLRPALGFLAVALILISFFAHGDGIALLPLLVGVAIMVALLSARPEKAGNERLATLAKRLDQSLESLKDLQWEVREREARYRDLLDHQGDVILRRDRDRRLTFVNDAFCRTFGLTRETALGQTFKLPW